MSGVNGPSWATVVALLIAFGGGTLTYYRLPFNSAWRARAVLAFTLATLVTLSFYVVAVIPYARLPWVGPAFAGLALSLLIVGVVLPVLPGSRPRRRLSLAQIRFLLPDSVRRLEPEQMRALLPRRFRGWGLHDSQLFILALLSETSPDTLRALSPERLRALLRRAIPQSILDQK